VRRVELVIERRETVLKVSSAGIVHTAKESCPLCGQTLPPAPEEILPPLTTCHHPVPGAAARTEENQLPVPPATTDEIQYPQEMKKEKQ
jgi:hypothetical protein